MKEQIKMIQKKIVEIFTFIFYWFIITPFVISVCHHYKLVTWDENDKMESIRLICGLILALAAGYVVVYLVIVLVYQQIKFCTMKAWKDIEQSRTIEMLQVERGYYEDNDPRDRQNSECESDGNETEEDEVDGRRAARRASNPPAERVHQPKRKPRKPIRHPAPPPPYEAVNTATH